VTFYALRREKLREFFCQNSIFQQQIQLSTPFLSRHNCCNSHKRSNQTECAERFSEADFRNAGRAIEIEDVSVNTNFIDF